MRRLRSFNADVRAAPTSVCRECGGVLPPRRRAYCSEACRVLWLVPRVWSVAVSAVWKRDQGVCALCARDAVDLRKQFLSLKAQMQSREPSIATAAGERRRWLVETLNREGFHLSAYCSFPAWGELFQVDHIVPVVEGGGGATLEGLRTLCTACHKAETAKLADRRKRRRKPQLPLPDLCE